MKDDRGNPGKIKLPAELAARLENQLGIRGMEEFTACLGKRPAAGLRLNTAKGTLSQLQGLMPFPLEAIPWAPAGFMFPEDERPGKLPYYQAGLYYLQDPSAMAPAAALDAQPGERVLDLCAAPGGKTTQIAAAMAGDGLLVANDYNPRRIKALIWNLEHWGATNCVVLNEEPERLAAAAPGFFDKILVDAPCSGEGMLRKDPEAARNWRKYSGRLCRETQDRLLDQAALMLAPGGRLVYSTCTFNPLENEGAVADFLERRPDFRLVPLPLFQGWQPGAALKDCRQLWPHLGDGEGQFFACMAKNTMQKGWDYPGSEGASAGRRPDRADGEAGGDSALDEELRPFGEFMKDNFYRPLSGPFALYNGHVYRFPPDLPNLAGLKVSRHGWYLGLIRNGRFTPSQHLAMGMKAERMKRRLDLDPREETTERYLKGETLMIGGDKGWTLVTLAGYPLGFGKQTGNHLKNEYASGWRLT